MRISSFNFAILSPPIAPVLINGDAKPTARCAMVSSVVSPDLWDTTGTMPFSFANFTVA